MTRGGQLAQSFARRLMAQWDHEDDAEYDARTHSVRQQIVVSITEHEERNAQRLELNLVPCERCSLEVPIPTTVSVLWMAVDERARFFCCQDCLGRWAAGEANLALYSRPTDSYDDVLTLIGGSTFTADELGGLIAFCDSQLREAQA